jgi:hypothetical protein
VWGGPCFIVNQLIMLPFQKDQGSCHISTTVSFCSDVLLREMLKYTYEMLLPPKPPTLQRGPSQRPPSRGWKHNIAWSLTKKSKKSRKKSWAYVIHNWLCFSSGVCGAAPAYCWLIDNPIALERLGHISMTIGFRGNILQRETVNSTHRMLLTPKPPMLWGGEGPKGPPQNIGVG